MILILDVNDFLYQIYIHKFIWETFVFFFSSSVMIEGWNFFFIDFKLFFPSWEIPCGYHYFVHLYTNLA